MVIVIGIDPGMTVTGYGVVTASGNLYQAIDFGCIRPPTRQTPSQRRLVIFEAVAHLLDQHKPTALSIETQFVLHNVRTAMSLGMVRGVVTLAASQRNIPVYEYSPSQAKKAVSGRGAAPKEQVQGMIQKLLRLSSLPKPFDVTDALSLAICHLQAAHGFQGVSQV